MYRRAPSNKCFPAFLFICDEIISFFFSRNSQRHSCRASRHRPSNIHGSRVFTTQLPIRAQSSPVHTHFRVQRVERRRLSIDGIIHFASIDIIHIPRRRGDRERRPFPTSARQPKRIALEATTSDFHHYMYICAGDETASIRVKYT